MIIKKEGEKVKVNKIIEKVKEDSKKAKEKAFENTLKCGCTRGYSYCPEAVRLWNFYCVEYQAENHKKAKRCFQEYENHFKTTTEPFYMSMKEWKKLMGYDKLWYRLRKVFFAIIRPYRKGSIL